MNFVPFSVGVVFIWTRLSVIFVTIFVIDIGFSEVTVFSLLHVIPNNLYCEFINFVGIYYGVNSFSSLS